MKKESTVKTSTSISFKGLGGLAGLLALSLGDRIRLGLGRHRIKRSYHGGGHGGGKNKKGKGKGCFGSPAWMKSDRIWEMNRPGRKELKKARQLIAAAQT